MCTLPNLQRYDLEEILSREKNLKQKAEAVQLIIATEGPLLLESRRWITDTFNFSL